MRFLYGVPNTKDVVNSRSTPKKPTLVVANSIVYIWYTYRKEQVG